MFVSLEERDKHQFKVIQVVSLSACPLFAKGLNEIIFRKAEGLLATQGGGGWRAVGHLDSINLRQTPWMA